MSGQPASFVSADGVPLTGRLHIPAGAGPHPAALVCHPHPLMGGSMHDRVVLAIVGALVQRGMMALRFDFRAQFGQGIAEQEDVAGAMDWLSVQPGVAAGHMALAGYSFGASVAARVAPRDPRIQVLALIAPPGENLTPDLLAGYTRPVCLVAGDRDHVCPATALRAWATRLSAPTSLHILPGVDHFFNPGLDRMAGLVADFLLDAR
ncbi:MAG: dienelactone hydrolase family protein [Chloroflexi bacterium]|nr:dienelactone hydrolase family protein [Chloroflexota bacterium]MBU1747987.1 dienelactone hydrolase family protein [Chloroflexota bacterium]MBU1878851.1 dienelactone hydrolase family protein [Chloroflexota bacterium]